MKALVAVYGFEMWMQDVTQAYLQSADKVMRDIYIRPPNDFHFADNQLLKLQKPLYGLAENIIRWYQTISVKMEILFSQRTGNVDVQQ